MSEVNVVDGDDWVLPSGLRVPRGGRPVVFGAVANPYPGSGHTREQAFLAHEAETGTVGCHRTFTAEGAPSAMPWDWTNMSEASGSGKPTYGDWEARWSWQSVKPDVGPIISGTAHNDIIASINSIPVTGNKRLITMWHEPEAKVPGTFSAAQWKEAAYRFGLAVQEADHPDVLYGPIFMSRFQIENGNVEALITATEHDLMEVFDFVGWDPYNKATEQNNYGAQFQGDAGTAYYFDSVRDFTATWFPGLPLAFGETSYINNPNDPTMRPAWIPYVGAWAVANGLLACCWYDSSIVNAWWLRIRQTVHNSTAVEDQIPDPDSTDAWGALYAAYPVGG